MSLPDDGLIDRLRAAGCVFAEDEARLITDAADSPADREAMVVRREAGLPLEQVLGWAEFCGLRIIVEPGVFVPRRRTELLVSEALAVLGSETAPVVVDLCCGSGAVGAALAAARPQADVYAADLDPAAVHCARRNLEPRGLVCVGDLYDALPATIGGRVDLLVVNAPYVPTEAIALMPPEARLYEAIAALDGGPDGLDVQRRVAAGAARWLRPGGHLLIETSDRQAPLTVAAMVTGGLEARVTGSAELDATVVVGQRMR